MNWPLILVIAAALALAFGISPIYRQLYRWAEGWAFGDRCQATTPAVPLGTWCRRWRDHPGKHSTGWIPVPMGGRYLIRWKAMGSSDRRPTINQVRRARGVAPLPAAPTAESSTCSWCHTFNLLTTRYCKNCGHEAHVPRQDCRCSRCVNPIEDGADNDARSPY